MICKNESRCTMKDRYCGVCKHNPNAELQDYFRDRGYIPVCEHGYDDCIHDPARKLYEYHNCSWTRQRYSLEELEKEVKNGCHCDDGDCYDDEDK